ncbi:MAG: methyltransferase [Prevotella sp.]|nr:methyltransferase [Prevotella sp.]
MGDRIFTFRQFAVAQSCCAMKVGTDGVLLGAWASGGRRILDVGTGTGLIAMMMAQRFAAAEVWALEIDAAACRQAAANFGACPFASRLHLVGDSVQRFAESTEEKFGVVVCNPPYFVDSLHCKDEQRTAARHNNRLTFQELFACSKRLLEPAGELCVIVPSGSLSALTMAAALNGFFIKARCDVRTTERKPPRRHLLSFVLRSPDGVAMSEHTLQNQDGSRSEWYAALTSAFYIH